MAGMGGFGSVRAWALAGASVAAIATPAWGQEAARPFNIPAQDMAAALEAFGRQSDTDILFSRPEVRGITSTAVSGNLRPELALRRLVSATRLAVRRVNGSTFVVERAPGDRTASDGPAIQLEEIVVTGTRIAGASPAAPVVVVSRSEIEASGYGQVGDVIRSLPQNFSGGQNPGIIAAQGSNTANQNITNSSTVNLRGLGADATLVLINGRRLGGDGFSQGADISAIPVGAINRIEVVTDGSSAIYGADAVAGVANFILRRDYQGLELSARVAGATEGGAREEIYGVLGGISGDRGFATLGIEIADFDGLLAADRDFSNGATPGTSLLRPYQRRSLLGSAGYEFGDGINLSADILLSDRSADYFFQTSPSATRLQFETEAESASAGSTLSVELPGGWSIDASGVYFQSQFERIQRSATAVSETTYENVSSYLEGVASGPLVQLPGGELLLAVGGGLREEKFGQLGATGLSASRDISYGFAEARVPLAPASNIHPSLQSLVLSLSARYEDYDDVGSTFVPKVGLRYEPIDGLALRATWGESFKAPAFTQLYTDRLVALYQAPALGGAPGETAFFITGGNPDLSPETSTSWTFGTDFIPSFMRSVTLSATYFSIDHTDRVVVPVSPATLGLSDQRFQEFVVRNPSADLQAVELAAAGRFINASGAPYNPANVTAILYNTWANATSQSVEGVDFSYRQTFDIGSATVIAVANATWIDLRQQTLPTVSERRLSGTIANVPDFRARAGATWQSGNLSVTGFVNHVADSIDTGVTPNRRVGSWSTMDATATYRFDGALDGLSAQIGVSNLFDRDPPFAASPAVLYNGIFYDSTTSSPVGRVVSFSLRKSF